MTDRIFVISLMASIGFHAALYFSPGTLLKEYLGRPEKNSFRVDYFSFSEDGVRRQNAGEVRVAEKPGVDEKKEMTTTAQSRKELAPGKTVAREAAPAASESGVNIQPAVLPARGVAAQKKRSQPEPGPRPGINKEAVASYFKVLRERLRESTVYPYGLKKEGIQGIVKLEFTLKASGELASVRMISPSDDKRLDAAAMDGISKASPFPSFPPEVRASSLTFNVSILFGTI